MDKLNAVRTSEAGADDWVSALVDGEMTADESRRAVIRMGKDAEALRLWSEYSLIGDVMRGCDVGRSDLGARVRAALAEEPTVLAPMAAVPEAKRTYYWMAAAAAVAAITWGVLSVAPQPGSEPALPVAANEPASGDTASNSEVAAYLDAHQDYAYAVVGEPEMRYTQVSLAGDGR